MRRTVTVLLAVAVLAVAVTDPVTVVAAQDGGSSDVRNAGHDELYPEETYDGGSLVAQSGEYSFYNDPDSMCFTAANTATGDTVRIADFPAANISIYGDTLIFTDMDQTITTAVHSSYINSNSRYLYGGGLYRIDSLSDIENDISISRIGEKDRNYYRVSYDENGLYCLCEDQATGTVEYNKLDNDGRREGYIGTEDGETILDVIELEGYLYLEIMSPNGISYILCVDRDNGTGSRTVFPGMNMHLISGRIIYWNTEDLYIYAVQPGSDGSYVISYFPVSSMYTLYDYIICRDEYDSVQGIDFCISRSSMVSLYDRTFYVPVNGWINMVEVFEFASPGSGPTKTPEEIGPSSASQPGTTGPGTGRTSTTEPGTTRPPESSGPDPNDAVREARDLCDYLQHSDMGRLEYNDTPALQERFLYLYFDGDTRTISSVIHEASVELAHDVNRKVGGSMTDDQIADAAATLYDILYNYLTSIVFDCRLKMEVRPGLAVVTISSDRRLNIQDIYSHVTQINQIYSLGYRQVDYKYGDYQVEVKASYKENEDHWRIDKADLEKLYSLIFGLDDPPASSGGSSSTSSVTPTPGGNTGPSSSTTGKGSSTSSSTTAGRTEDDKTGAQLEGKACIPVRDIPDLVFIREKNMVGPTEVVPTDRDTESAIRAYKELLEGYSYPAIGEAFRNTSDALNMWFLGEETRREIREQVNTINDYLLDDHYEQMKKDPNNKHSVEELEEEKKKDRAAFEYLDKLIRDYDPQTFSEKAVALYDGYSDMAKDAWRSIKGFITGKDYQSEYIREQFDARNRAYNWMMHNIYSEMYDRSKDRIDNDRYQKASNISYCMTF